MSEKETYYDRTLTRLKNSKWLVLLFIVVLGLGIISTVVEDVSKLWGSSKEDSEPKKENIQVGCPSVVDYISATSRMETLFSAFTSTYNSTMLEKLDHEKDTLTCHRNLIRELYRKMKDECRVHEIHNQLSSQFPSITYDSLDWKGIVNLKRDAFSSFGNEHLRLFSSGENPNDGIIVKELKKEYFKIRIGVKDECIAACMS